MVHLPDGFYIPLHNEEWDKFLDHAELKPKKKPQIAQKKNLGIKGKMKKNSAGKAQMKKTLAMHEESSCRRKVDDDVQEGAVPAYLLDLEQTARAKILSNTVKQNRKEKAGKWDVPLPKVRPVAEDELFKVIKTGKRKAIRSDTPEV